MVRVVATAAYIPRIEKSSLDGSGNGDDIVTIVVGKLGAASCTFGV